MSIHPPTSTPSTPTFRYTATLADQIERRWQAQWDADLTFRQPNPGEPDFDARKPKFYCLDMFPYPSGAGLHVGHPEGYTATDIISRFKRMKGFNVLHPMGWDAFGLPAEQYAIQTGIHPAITTKNSIDNFRRQLKRFGFSYDWTREYGTIDEGYYKWTQWIFLQLYNSWFDASAPSEHEARASASTETSVSPAGRARPISELVELLESGDAVINMFGELVIHGAHPNVLTGEAVGLRQWHELTEKEREDFLDSQRLAYRDQMVVNWCPKLGTVLANDEVTADGLSERGGYPVLRKPLKQWVFRITAYADRLLRQLDALDWPESTKAMQREWIGRSEGAEIEFELDLGGSRVPAESASLNSLRVFTTRPDTIFGATYMVVAPEHELCDAVIKGVAQVPDATRSALASYVQWAKNRSDVERQEAKEKTGVFTGVHAINPATGAKIPVWTADYVLTGYGTGAIMAVPAHDERDFEFAQKFKLPIRDVVYPRPVHAMKYFCEHAYPDGNASATWRDELADLLGLVSSASDKNESLDVAHRVVRDRRRGTPRATLTGVALDKPGALGEQRGATRAIWLEVLDDLNVASFTDLCHRFRDAAYYATLGEAYSGIGTGTNSANDEVSLNNLSLAQAKEEIIHWLRRKGVGNRKINYRLRDWVFSRQRYWGEPFPIVYDESGRAYPISASHLPVRLPELADYAPVESSDPQPLLAKATSWVRTTAGEAGVDPKLLPSSTPVTRETNTMPGSAGSSWYAIRYCDAKNNHRFVSKEAEKYWMGGTQGGGVDLYLGGSEHAVGHLLYSRFWQNVLFDLGHCSTPEPFHKLFHQGLITSFAYQRPDKSLVPVDQVKEVADGKFFEIATEKPVAQITAKMSKSLKNVVNPDDVIAEFGADTFRLYEMYMGPLDASKPWNPRDIGGLHRFLQRAWRVMVSEESGQLRLADAADPKLERQLHRLIYKVGHDIDRLAFNTAIAAMIEFVNSATASDPGASAASGGPAVPAGSSRGALTRDQVQRFVLTLAPFVPHIAEEIWHKLGNAGSITHASWPTHDEAMLKDNEIEIPISLMGKVKSRVVVPAGADAKAIEAAALAEPKIVELLAGKSIKKVIVVPGKMVNIVHG